MNKLYFNMLLLIKREDWLCKQFENRFLKFKKEESHLWLEMYERGFLKLAVTLAPPFKNNYPMPYWATFFDKLSKTEETPQERCLMNILLKWKNEVGLDELKKIEIADKYSRWSSFMNDFDYNQTLEQYIQENRPHFWTEFSRKSLDIVLPSTPNETAKKIRL